MTSEKVTTVVAEPALNEILNGVSEVGEFHPRGHVPFTTNRRLKKETGVGDEELWIFR